MSVLFDELLQIPIEQQSELKFIQIRTSVSLIISLKVLSHVFSFTLFITLQEQVSGSHLICSALQVSSSQSAINQQVCC